MSRRTLRIIPACLLLLASCTPPQAPKSPASPPAPVAVTPPAPVGQPTGPLVAIKPRVPLQFRDLYPGEDRELMAPAGFSVSVFAAGLKNPRLMAQGPDGAIYVAEKGASRVSRLSDANSDGVADAVEVYATGLDVAHSLVWHQGSLYVGATDGIYRFTPPIRPDTAGTKIVELPARSGHSTRTARFGPDGKLYVTIGSSCNVCTEADPRRAAMWVYNADGSGGRLFAKGLRNTVDFTFQPGTNAIYGVDNGRDQLGDDSPPEEVNLIKDSADYGWPYCHGGTITDPQLGKPNSCDGTEPPAVKMQAHSAPLGATFYTGKQFPALYQESMFVTFHGSWNRSIPTGYKVVMIPFRDGKPAGSPQDFLAGWLTRSRTWGRPVGVLQAADGALLVSDDNGGVIYRVTYTGR